MYNKFTFGGFVPVVINIKPFGSFVLNLNDIKLCLPVSQGGRIYKYIIDVYIRSTINMYDFCTYKKSCEMKII